MKDFNKKLLGIIMAFTLLLSLIIPSVSKVFASAPANTGDYGALQINSNKTLIVSEVTDAESVSLTFKDGDTTVGTATVTGTGLYTTDNNNLVYTNNDVTVTANPEDGYEVSMVLKGDNVTSPAEVTGFVAGGAPQIVDINFAEEGSEPVSGGPVPFDGGTLTSSTFTYANTGIVPADFWVNDTEIAVGQAPQTDPMEYYYNATTGKVTFKFATFVNNRLTSITINETSYTNSLPTTKEGWLEANEGQTDAVYIEVPYSDTYNIVTTTTEDFDWSIGNFLWSEDCDPRDDNYVKNGIVEFVSLEYNGTTYNSLQELRNANKNYLYFDELESGVHDGSAVLPAGSILTVRLLPNAGYQLTSFSCNGQEFEPQEEIGTYTFEVPAGNFHWGAKFTKVANEVDAEDADAITGGSIKLGGAEESMQVGTAKLGVSNVDLEPAIISNFKDAADGYDVKTYLDISLFNTVYKATASKSWDTQVDELDHEATITLQLADDVDGNEIVIVHEKHDGTYEVIPTVYNASNHTITFKTSSFSNYAIASRTVTSPKTGDNIVLYGTLLVASLAGLVIFSKKKKRI